MSFNQPRPREPTRSFDYVTGAKLICFYSILSVRVRGEQRKFHAKTVKLFPRPACTPYRRNAYTERAFSQVACSWATLVFKPQNKQKSEKLDSVKMKETRSNTSRNEQWTSVNRYFFYVLQRFSILVIVYFSFTPYKTVVFIYSLTTHFSLFSLLYTLLTQQFFPIFSAMNPRNFYVPTVSRLVNFLFNDFISASFSHSQSDDLISSDLKQFFFFILTFNLFNYDKLHYFVPSFYVERYIIISDLKCLFSTDHGNCLIFF